MVRLFYNTSENSHEIWSFGIPSCRSLSIYDTMQRVSSWLLNNGGSLRYSPLPTNVPSNLDITARRKAIRQSGRTFLS